jgi:hypothetical protein
VIDFASSLNANKAPPTMSPAHVARRGAFVVAASLTKPPVPLVLSVAYRKKIGSFITGRKQTLMKYELTYRIIFRPRREIWLHSSYKRQ